MLCDIFPAPSSTEITADWTKERRDHIVTQTLRLRHHIQPPCMYLPATTSHYQPLAANIDNKFHSSITPRYQNVNQSHSLFFSMQC